MDSVEKLAGVPRSICLIDCGMSPSLTIRWGISHPYLPKDCQRHSGSLI